MYTSPGKRGIWLTVICIAVYFSVSGTEFFRKILLAVNSSEDFWSEYINLIFYLIFFILFFTVCRSQLKLLKADYIENMRKYVWTAVAVLLILVVAIVACNIILRGFGIGDSTNQEIIEEAMKKNKGMVFVSAVLLGPFVEEMMFRHHIFTLIRGEKGRKIRRTAAYIVTSAAFALYHTTIKDIVTFNVSELLTLIPYFIVSLGFCFMQDRTDNVLCPLSVHMAVNLIGTL